MKCYLVAGTSGSCHSREQGLDTRQHPARGREDTAWQEVHSLTSLVHSTPWVSGWEPENTIRGEPWPLSTKWFEFHYLLQRAVRKHGDWCHFGMPK